MAQNFVINLTIVKLKVGTWNFHSLRDLKAVKVKSCFLNIQRFNYDVFKNNLRIP